MNKVKDEQATPPVRGEGLFKKLETPFLWLDRLIERHLPASLNPMAQTGAIANVCFMIALISGILMLFWYVPSVHQAWQSLEEMGWFGRTIRALHRYSSDATICFVMLHALKMLFARRFGGARWMAWVTGIALLGLMWFVGWLGYWLVWDVRAESVAVGTAKFLEVLPIFTEPMSRTFLTDEMVSTGLFFMIFFFHMLIPLAIGIALWLHISRVNRPKFLTSKALLGWIVGALLVASVFFPVENAAKADMATHAEAFTSDWWFLLPLTLTERLSAGALWAVGLVGTILAVAIPWSLTKERVLKAEINTSRCNGCTLCVQDCPYNAIVMVPRKDGRDRYSLQAELDSSKCVGCGICAGSCNPGGIGLPQMPVMEKRKQVDGWIDDVLERDEAPLIAFLCANSAASEFEFDDEGRCPQLPGYRVVPVPCSGWVHTLTLERAIRRGARGLMVVGCSGSDPYYREGVKWTEDRIAGLRDPGLRRDKIDASRIKHVQYNRTNPDGLVEQARAFRNEIESNETSPPTSSSSDGFSGRRLLVGAALTALLTIPVVGGADLPSLVPTQTDPELVVSFKYRPRAEEECRAPEGAEKARLRHMQRDEICERKRPDVRMQVWLGGNHIHEQLYEPKGLSDDGPSIAVERFAPSLGDHEVEIRIAPAVEEAEAHTWHGNLTFDEGQRRVILFEGDEGFIVE